MNTETWGSCLATTQYLDAPDGGRLALTRITHPQVTPSLPGVVLLPGLFSNRHFWISPKGVGLAAQLAAAGHTAWLLERRHTGQSPESVARAGLEEHLRQDLPAVQAYIQAHSPGPLIWGGHSFGGVIAARAVAETLSAQGVAGLLLFASQIEVDKPILCWPRNLFLRGLSRLCRGLPARRLGMGPENETIAAIDDACHWRMNTQYGGDLLKPLEAIQCPVLAFGGGADKVDPPDGCRLLIDRMASTDKRFVLLAKDQGYGQDYDHPGIVVSKAAASEVWPQVLDWAAERG